MGITTYKKTRFVRTSDYVFSSVTNVGDQYPVLIINGTAGKINSVKINSTTALAFILEIDGSVQTATLQFNNTTNEQWISPELDLFTTTPNNCSISFSNSFALRVSTGSLVSLQIHSHFEYDTEVAM